MKRNVRTENRLFAGQVSRMVGKLQEPEYKDLFLQLVIEAKEAAHKDMLEHSTEYNTAVEKEWMLYDRLMEREEFKTSRVFEEYLDAADLADTIWAEEMYLKGMQDAVTFIMLTSRNNVYDTTGISVLGGVPMDKNGYDIENLSPDIRKMAQQIGVDNLIKVTEALGGRYLFIPKKENLLMCFYRGMRNEEIRADQQKGMTYEQIAQKHGISVSTVCRALIK